ncbi:glucose-1-phosphate adenylyltransferase [bacterium]|nr:glucose-1-phosphate adenylyltransferase [bacterium]
MRKNIVCLILGGGRGTRLFPLTEYRSKPAVPLAGNYRLIDIPISNCLNCDINRIYVLTQFNSVSLHRHIRQTYRFDRFSNGFIEILAAQQTMEGDNWYQGTADAVRKQIRYIQQPDIDYVLVLSGDQLYRMDFEAMLENHLAAGADASIAALPVTDEDAKAFGVMRIDESGRVHGFLEKPQTTKEMDMVRMDPAWIDHQGIPSKGRSLLASMGIYLFNRDCLVELLQKNDYTDFGKEVFPMSIRARNVHVNLFDGYWEDIGTIRAFYDANLALAGEHPPFDLIDERNPIFTRARALAPARILDATVRRSLIAPGAFIETNAVIENSIVGLRCHVGNSASIRSSIIMGDDFYESADGSFSSELPALGIGEGSIVEGAIVDKNVRIGRNCKVRLRPGIEADCDINGVNVRDGIIVVPKGAVLPDGWEL